MGFLQKLESNGKSVYLDIRNINFITSNREKDGCLVHPVLNFHQKFHERTFIEIDTPAQFTAYMFKGMFVKLVCTRRNETQDNSSFYKFHSWINTGNIIQMLQNEVFKEMTDIKFVDGTVLIICALPIEIIRGISQLKKESQKKK